jgi:outer membrane protein
LVSSYPATSPMQHKLCSANLATALGTRATDTIRVQPIDQLAIPESIGDSVDQAIDRALEQRPDLMQQVAEVRKTNASVKEARAAYYPALSVSATPNAQSLHGLQQQLPWAHTADLTGELQLKLTWTLLDGGARKNNLARAQANLRAAEARVNVTQDNIADEVWKSLFEFGDRAWPTASCCRSSQRGRSIVFPRWSPTTMVSATYLTQRPLRQH